MENDEPRAGSQSAGGTGKEAEGFFARKTDTHSITTNTVIKRNEDTLLQYFRHPTTIEEVFNADKWVFQNFFGDDARLVHGVVRRRDR
jgi:hypothetical protein